MIGLRRKKSLTYLTPDDTHMMGMWQKNYVLLVDNWKKQWPGCSKTLQITARSSNSIAHRRRRSLLGLRNWSRHQIVADIRGGRDKDDNSSVRLYHLFTWRHTPHPHCPPSVGGNIFPQSMHLSHISYCTFTYIHANSQFNVHQYRRTPYSGSGRRVRSISLDFT